MAARYYRRVIRITAEDSPNVQLARMEQRAGRIPSGREVLEGVLSWEEYQRRLATWDDVRRCVGLMGQFWQGKDVLMYPPDWLDRAERIAELVRARGINRVAKAVGIDCAEGGDSTCWAASDEYGLIDLVSKKTADTSVIVGDTIAFGQRWKCPAEKWYFDRGGGGKQAADTLRAKRFMVKTVAFGSPVSFEPKRGRRMFKEKEEMWEQKYVYKNMRALMYGLLMEQLDPSREEVDRRVKEAEDGVANTGAGNGTTQRTDRRRNSQDPSRSNYSRDNRQGSGHGGPAGGGRTNGEAGSRFLSEVPPGYGIPKECGELRRQLSLIPKRFDGEGRLYLLPKRPKVPGSDEETLFKLLGRSPDEADAVVLSVYGMLAKSLRPRAGVI